MPKQALPKHSAIEARMADIKPPCRPGFLGTIGAVEGVPAFWMSLYGYAWFTGFLIAGGVYLALQKLSPVRQAQIP